MASHNGEQHPCFSVYSQNLRPLRFFLQSNDGHIIEIEEKVGMQFDAVKRLLHQGHISLTYDCRRVIALNSSRFILDLVIGYTRDYAKLADRVERAGCGYVTLIRARSETDLKFIKYVTGKQVFGFDKPQCVRVLGDIAAAAGDLGMQRLLDISCGALAQLIQDYSEEQIYALLGVRIRKLDPMMQADEIAACIGHARDLQRRSYGSYPNCMAGGVSEQLHPSSAFLPQTGTNILQNPEGRFYWVGEQGQEVIAEEMNHHQPRFQENDIKKASVTVPPPKGQDMLSLTFGQLRIRDEGPLFTDMEMLRIIK